MDRILILMAAAEFSDAQTALYSARENASEPAALSYGVTLTVEPDAEANAAMAALPQLQFLCPEEDAWRSMPALWQGEGYVLMAHPAMRFTRGWDKALLRELASCAAPVKKPSPLPRADQEDAPVPAGMGQVLTGFLPVREDPLDAVCPVAADALTVDGTLTFRHGVPLRYAERALRGPFLHPDFCFGPAGFFRAMAEADSAAEDEGLKQSIMRYAIEIGDITQRVYVKEMEAPVEDMKRFLDGILHLYDEGRTKVKMGDLFEIKNEARNRLNERNDSVAQ